MKQTKPVAVATEAQMDVVSMDLFIEVLEHRTVLIAAAGACTSSSSSCSNINIELLEAAY